VRNDDRWVEKRLRVVRKALDAKHLMRAIARAVRGGYRRNEIASLRKAHAGAAALAAATAAGAPAAVAALLREGQVDAAVQHCARAIENEQKAGRPVTPLCFVAMAEAHECELNTNRERKHKVHTVVMFIFLVSNIGGTLLPIGDPPLFLG
jgi:hypothetical protein